MGYFEQCKTIADVKKRYHELCIALHPDNGGNAQMFSAMYAEYERVFNAIKNGYESNNADNTTNHYETPEQWAAIVSEVIRYTGVNVEIIGAWCWLTGNTYAYRENIKQLGFVYSRSKKAWYHTGDIEQNRKRIRGHYTLDKCRTMHGSRTIKANNDSYIE